MPNYRYYSSQQRDSSCQQNTCQRNNAGHEGSCRQDSCQQGVVRRENSCRQDTRQQDTARCENSCRQDSASEAVMCCNDNSKYDELSGMPLAMAYVPWQKWCSIYEADKGFMRGTIFEQLDKPFLGAGGCAR